MCVCVCVLCKAIIVNSKFTRCMLVVTSTTYWPALTLRTLCTVYNVHWSAPTWLVMVSTPASRCSNTIDGIDNTHYAVRARPCLWYSVPRAVVTAINWLICCFSLFCFFYGVYSFWPVLTSWMRIFSRPSLLLFTVIVFKHLRDNRILFQQNHVRTYPF